MSDGAALIYGRRNAQEARQDLATWLTKWQSRYAKLCEWVESNIEETLTFYRLPQAHHKQLKSTNMLERINQELKRRTLLVRIFPDAASCLRLVRALAAEIDEDWVKAARYLNMEFLRERACQEFCVTDPVVVSNCPAVWPQNVRPAS